MRNSAVYYSETVQVPEARKIKTQDRILIREYVVLRQCRANYLGVL